MNCYFDTSIYNRILDDQDKDLIIENIKRKSITAIPSLVNLCEILQTPDKERKQSLLSIYHEIRNDYHALKPFTILLRDAVEAIQEGNIYVEVNMPVKIDAETEQLCKDVLKNPGKEFDEYALKARGWLFEEKRIKYMPDSKTFLKNSNDERMNQIWIELFKKGACEGLGIKGLKLNDDTILQIVKDPNSPWKYHLDTYLLILYRRAMKTEGYGKKTNPGGADLIQGIYLSWSDIFVIRDGNFYDFMKELKYAQGYQKEIFTYGEFKKYLGIEQQG
ncbi:MAG: hypothetical protein U9O50_08375 [Acidobacteriota bacterium]|nr:hypothetical protein [Acidobacteriota bacterium]